MISDSSTDRLAEHDLSISNCTNINIFLSSMELFPAMNAVYATFFGTSPPARACVAVDLPRLLRVRFDCIAFGENNPLERQALHVQGLSYWAPANIGPYSQAITAGEQIFISGQIGLLPSHLSLPVPRSLKTEMALASQHVARIARVLKPVSDSSWVGFTQVALYWLTEARDLVNIRKAHELTEVYSHRVSEMYRTNIFSVVRSPTLLHFISSLKIYRKMPKWRNKFCFTADVVGWSMMTVTVQRHKRWSTESVSLLFVPWFRPWFILPVASVETTSDFLIRVMTAELGDSGEACTIVCVKAKTMGDVFLSSMFDPSD
jgi:enamine deaminase RidA (YjgF/YER057c/UK114 family)